MKFGYLIYFLFVEKSCCNNSSVRDIFIMNYALIARLTVYCIIYSVLKLNFRYLCIIVNIVIKLNKVCSKLIKYYAFNSFRLI